MEKQIDSGEKKISEIYTEIFHYTDVYGLEGIVSNNNIWATHPRFLNDYSEIFHSRDGIREIAFKKAIDALSDLQNNETLKPLFENEGGYDRIIRNEISGLLDSIYETTLNVTPPFVASFSAPDINAEKEDGSLDLWRAYAKDTDGGYAIAFDTEEMEKLAEIETINYKYYAFHISDVQYNMEDDLDQIEAFCDSIFSVYRTVLNEFGIKSVNRVMEIEELFHSAMYQMTRYKNVHFKNENEVRFLVSPQTRRGTPSGEINGRPIFYRKSGGCLIPTTAFFGPDIGKLPIKRIIVGPGRNAERKKAGLEYFLQEKKVSADVHISRIPYNLL